jgi:hypothetical protein
LLFFTLVGFDTHFGKTFFVGKLLLVCNNIKNKEAIIMVHLLSLWQEAAY